MEIFTPINVKNAVRILLRFLITQIALNQSNALLEHTQILLCINALIAHMTLLHYRSMKSVLTPMIALQELLGAKSSINAEDVRKTPLLIRIEPFAPLKVTVQMELMRISHGMTASNVQKTNLHL